MDNNTFIGNTLDRGPWILYDTFTVAVATAIVNPLQFFAVPIGQNPPGSTTPKTKLLTNMKKNNQLPQPQRFLLRSLGFYFSPSTWLPDIIQMLEGAYFEFKIDEKIYHEGLLEFYPSGLGVEGNSTVNNQQVYQIGQKTLTARRDFGDYARVISDALSFSCNLIMPTALTSIATASGGNGMNVVCVLDGILDRLVQ